MNQSGEDLPPMISQKIQFRNSIVDVNQNYTLHKTNRMTKLLHKLLISLAPAKQNLTCFPLITILHHKDIYHESMTGDWAPDSQQADVYYKNHYALTNFIPTKPSPKVALAIGKLTQFASDMNYENLTISITPTPSSLPQAKTDIEFYVLLESIFPTTTLIAQIVTAPEPQPLSHESDAALRRMSVTRTPAQILAPQNPAMKTVRSFKTRQVEVGQQIGKLQRITKLFNTPQTSDHSSLSNQP